MLCEYKKSHNPLLRHQHWDQDDILVEGCMRGSQSWTRGVQDCSLWWHLLEGGLCWPGHPSVGMGSVGMAGSMPCLSWQHQKGDPFQIPVDQDLQLRLNSFQYFCDLVCFHICPGILAFCAACGTCHPMPCSMSICKPGSLGPEVVPHFSLHLPYSHLGPSQMESDVINLADTVSELPNDWQ